MTRDELRAKIRPLAQKLADDIVDRLLAEFDGARDRALTLAREALELELEDRDEPATISTEPAPAPRPRAASRRATRIPAPSPAPSPSPASPPPSRAGFAAIEAAAERRSSARVDGGGRSPRGAARPVRTDPEPEVLTPSLPTPIASFDF